MPHQINVDLGDRGYPIYIGEGLLGQLPDLCKRHDLGSRVVVITNNTVARLYGENLGEAFSNAGIRYELIAIPEGEDSKSLSTAGDLYQELAKRHAERGTPILALGGGVIGDLAGFVAATYQRGVPFIQVPTTLLAQVDSSIGGKVAVNVGRLKNMAGAFYQPKMVVGDTSALRTLPVEEIRNGLAEVIKCAVIRDPELFTFLEGNITSILDKEIGALTFAVTRAAEVKARVVEKDERDKGLRHILNFGHTFGHAIECVSDFKIAHGTAIAIGMAAAARLANRLELLSGFDLERITKLITAAGLPVFYPVKHPESIIGAMQHDKKITDSRMKFILPTGIGGVTARTAIDAKMAVEALSP